MYVALYDGAIVGTASIDDDHIYMVFADMQYRGKGIEEKLLSLMEEIASNNGRLSIMLHTHSAAQAFYEKLGYRLNGEFESEESGKEIIMEKNL